MALVGKGISRRKKGFTAPNVAEVQQDKGWQYPLDLAISKTLVTNES